MVDVRLSWIELGPEPAADVRVSWLEITPDTSDAAHVQVSWLALDTPMASEPAADVRVSWLALDTPVMAAIEGGGFTGKALVHAQDTLITYACDESFNQNFIQQQNSAILHILMGMAATGSLQ